MHATLLIGVHAKKGGVGEQKKDNVSSTVTYWNTHALTAEKMIL
jgi:hypothetical protein